MHEFVGCCKIEVYDQQTGITFPVLVLYPTETASSPVAFGPFALEVSMEAPVAEGRFPLVMISHGTGGSHLTHRTLGMYLVKNGFVVGMPEHAFNNRHDNTWQYTIQNMTHRPRHIQLAIDKIISHDKFIARVESQRVALVGHSVGGYTALALAGGRPHTQFIVAQCERPESADEPYWLSVIRKNGIKSQPIEVAADGRVKAVVLMAPDVSLFMPAEAWRDVHVPILLLVAEKDYKPVETIELMLKSVPEPSKLRHYLIKNAGHYSFLSPFPESMKSRVGDAARDPEGFDRDRFHRDLYPEIMSFLSDALESNFAAP